MQVHTGVKTILHLIETTELGGAEKVLVNLAWGLEKRDFYSIVCLREEGSLQRELMERGVETYILKEGGFFDLRFLMNLLGLVIRKRVSIIHAHEFLMNVYGTVLGVLSARPVVTTLHGKFYYIEKWRRRTALRLVSRFSQLVCVSEDLRFFVSKSLQIPSHRIKTIHNGVDLDTSLRNKVGSNIKSELGIEDGCKVIGTIASLYPIKGHRYLLYAIPNIIQRYPKVIFLFIGKGEEEEKLRNEAANIGVSSSVRFLGFRSDVLELLNSMNVFVLPSLSECLPLSVLEAMASCVPAVVTDVGGVREIIEDGETGYVVPSRDPTVLAEKILALLENEKKATSMGLKAREVIRNRFSLKKMMDEYTALYNSLIQRDKSERSWS